MDHQEFQRMDRVRREIRTSAVDLVSDIIGVAYPDIRDIQLVEDFAFEAAEKIITAHAEEVASGPSQPKEVASQHAPDGGNPPQVPCPKTTGGVRVPDEQSILGRPKARTKARRSHPSREV